MDVLTKTLLFGEPVDLHISGDYMETFDAVSIDSCVDKDGINYVKVNLFNKEDILDEDSEDSEDNFECEGNCGECELNSEYLYMDEDIKTFPDTDAFEEDITLEELNGIMLEDFIENVYFNENKGTTTLKMKDGTTTTVKCTHGDKFDKEVGVKTAMLKFITGGTGKFNNVVNYWVEKGIDTGKNTKKTKESKEKLSKMMEEINKAAKELYEAKKPYTIKED